MLCVHFTMRTASFHIDTRLLVDRGESYMKVTVTEYYATLKVYLMRNSENGPKISQLQSSPTMHFNAHEPHHIDRPYTQYDITF